MNRRDPDHMIRKDPDRGGGRRPLLATFVGNNRQMLNEIRDNLSHLRRNVLEGDGEGTGGGGVQPLKGDLSQSTPNLADKAAVAVPSGPKKGLEYHHKTLAEIRDSLRPFQTVNRGQSGNESETSRQKIQQIMALGVDEVSIFTYQGLEFTIPHMFTCICLVDKCDAFFWGGGCLIFIFSVFSAYYLFFYSVPHCLIQIGFYFFS